MLMETFEKALITALLKYAGKIFKKKTYEKQIQQSVHSAFTAHANDLLPLCNNDEFTRKLFSLAAGEFFNPKELLGLGIASSKENNLNFSKAKIIGELRNFSITLMNIFQEIDSSAGKMPNTFSKFYDSIDRLSFAYRNTEINADEFEALWEKMQRYNLSSEISQLRYIGFRLSRKEPPSLNLLDVFVPLEVEISGRRHAENFELLKQGSPLERIGKIKVKDIPFARFGEEDKRTETVPFSSLMAGNKYITVLGDPGSGKTTLLKWIAILAAHGRSRLQKEFGLNEPILALPVSVGQLAKIKNKSGVSVSVFEALAYYFKSRNIGDADQLKVFFKLCFKGGKCLLLLDGLDEVKSNERDMIRNWIELFVSNNANNRFLVTSRIVAYSGFQMPGKGITGKVQPFDDKQVKKYVEEFSKSYFRWETGDEKSELWRQESEKLLQVLSNYRRLKALARNPFLLSGLALIQRAEGRLPRHRVQFYDIFARCLCETWNDARCMVASQIGCAMSFEEEAIPVLGTLAIRMTDEYPAGRAPKEFVLDTLAEALYDVKGVEPSQCRRAAQSFLEHTEKDLQLFLERGPDEWGFLHLTFQEYFAMAGLHYNEDFEKAALVHLFDPDWEEIIRLGVGYLAIIQTRGKAAANFIKTVLKTTWKKKLWITNTLGLNIPLAALLCAEAGNAVPKDLKCLIADKFAKWFFENDFMEDFADRILTDISLTELRDVLTQPFAKALKDVDPSVRTKAASAIALLKSDTAVPYLTESFKDEDFSVRTIAALALASTKSKAAIPTLIETLKDEDSFLRAIATLALASPKSKAAIPTLIEELKDDDSSVRAIAALALGLNKSKAAIPTLIEALEDEDSSVRKSVVSALGEMKSEVAIPNLTEMLKDDDSSVRITAALALGEMKSEAAIPTLIAALKDEHLHIRTSAVLALGKMKSEVAIPDLIEALKDKSSFVRMGAAKALGEMKSEAAIPTLITALKDEDSFVRKRAAMALKLMKSEAAVSNLIEALKDEDSSVRITAALALGEMKSEAAIPTLITALKNEDSSVRKRAAKSLGEMKLEVAIPNLIEALKDEDSSVRKSVVSALGEMKSEVAIPNLIEALKDEDSSVRITAALALGEMKSEAAIPTLITALKNEDSSVRKRAAKALIRLI